MFCACYASLQQAMHSWLRIHVQRQPNMKFLKEVELRGRVAVGNNVGRGREV